MAQMRTIEGVYHEIKTTDPATCITKNALRTLVTSGEIPSVKVGAKYLVSMDAVTRYFSSGLERADDLSVQ